jgi:competence protein ComEC
MKLSSFSSFWHKHPALFLGLALLMGTAMQLHWNPMYIAILFGLLAPLSQQQRLLFLGCAGLSFALTFSRVNEITLPQEKLSGKGVFHPEKLKFHNSPFNRSLLYQGVLLSFTSDEGVCYENLPCQLFLANNRKREKADCDYLIEGTLLQKDTYAFVLKPNKLVPWEKIDHTFSVAEMRFLAKQSLSNDLKRKIKDKESATLLSALATGEVDERMLTLEFGKVGIQHILAISGFHFALITLFLGSILRLLLPYRISLIALFLFLTLYYAFLGDAPSIQRAYIAISLLLFARYFKLSTSGLNALGVGLMVEVLLNPRVVLELSFQLSFLCTLAILLFYPLVSHYLQYLLPKRPFYKMIQCHRLDQHAYIAAGWIREALALNLAVHFISLPVLLFLFHKFPYLSLAYNLFFPACLSLSLLLLCSALLLPFASHFIHAINNQWTSALLSLTSHPPAALDFSLRCNTLPLSFVLLFLFASFSCAIAFQERLK